ncbi:MAG: hypothetical protein HOW97_37325 [Catenulispora sp.]|nr:hypothetical protein [Catenulispora sp.]
MEPVTFVTAGIVALSSIVRMWTWQRTVRHLPPGSRIVDLGRRGVVIEVGGQGDGASR